MLSADRVPVKSTRSLGAMAQMGCPDLSGRLAWVRYAIIALSNLVVRVMFPHVFVALPYAGVGSGVLYVSFRVIMAQAMRAILLAKATAAIFVDLRSISRTSQGCFV